MFSFTCMVHVGYLILSSNIFQSVLWVFILLSLYCARSVVSLSQYLIIVLFYGPTVRALAIYTFLFKRLFLNYTILLHYTLQTILHNTSHTIYIKYNIYTTYLENDKV